MSNPTSIPQFLKELKAERIQLSDAIKTSVLTLGDGSKPGLVSAAGALIGLGTRRDIVAYVIETLHRGATVGNQDPVYRLQMLEDLLLDRLYGEIDSTTSALGHGAIAVRQRVLRDMIRRTRGLRTDLEKGR